MSLLPSSGRSSLPIALLAEDEPMTRELLAIFLRNLGFHVIEAGSGTECLELLDTIPHERITLLVSDLIMPRMSGLDLMMKVRETLPDLPVLLISGYTDDLLILQEQINRYTLFLRKPFNFAVMKEKLIALVPDLATQTTEQNLSCGMGL